MKKILAIGAHPDDLEPQIGGVLAKLKFNGASVLNVTAVITGTGANNVVRHAEGKAAANKLGAGYLCLDQEQDNFSYNRHTIKLFDELFEIEKPDLVFHVSPYDSHNDHQTVANCVKSASRKNKFSIISLNQAFPGGITPISLNYFNDISDFLDIKRAAVECYVSQIEKYGTSWLESIIARDKYWGFNLSCLAAEAASVEKWINH